MGATNIDGLTPREAVALQRELAGRVLVAPLGREVRTIAGIDVSIRGSVAQAGIVVMDVGQLEVIDHAIWTSPVQFPYVPGLLSFRELPAILPAFDSLSIDPDVFMLDAQGMAHPRRFGLACHLGVHLEKPAFGVAKSRLTGAHNDPSPERGAAADLIEGEDLVGRVVRTRTGVRPVFVSVGHRVTLDEAVALTMATSVRYRLPEPTRLAHHLSKHGRLLSSARPNAKARPSGEGRPSL